MLTVITLPTAVTEGPALPEFVNATLIPLPDSPTCLAVKRSFTALLVFKSEITVAAASCRTGCIGALSRVPMRKRYVAGPAFEPASSFRSPENRNVAVFVAAL